MTGVGPRWEAIAALFRTTCRRLGLHPRGDVDLATPRTAPATFRRPRPQLALFDDAPGDATTRTGGPPNKRA
jgi:hypothetical protein